MNPPDISNRIREWRNRRRMSLAELGEAVGLSRSEISKLESGHRRIRADHLVVLAKALKISPEDLMDKETVREMIGEGPARPFEFPQVRVMAAHRQGGTIILQVLDASATTDAPPILARVPGAYAFYMPDESREPRVPVGALVFVHPLLPVRSGDLAVITLTGSDPVLASVERREKQLIAIVGGGQADIDLSDTRLASAHRVAGLWFS